MDQPSQTIEALQGRWRKVASTSSSMFDRWVGSVGRVVTRRAEAVGLGRPPGTLCGWGWPRISPLRA